MLYVKYVKCNTIFKIQGKIHLLPSTIKLNKLEKYSVHRFSYNSTINFNNSQFHFTFFNNKMNHSYYCHYYCQFIFDFLFNNIWWVIMQRGGDSRGRVCHQRGYPV